MQYPAILPHVHFPSLYPTLPSHFWSQPFSTFGPSAFTTTFSAFLRQFVFSSFLSALCQVHFNEAMNIIMLRVPQRFVSGFFLPTRPPSAFSVS